MNTNSNKIKSILVTLLAGLLAKEIFLTTGSIWGFVLTFPVILAFLHIQLSQLSSKNKEQIRAFLTKGASILADVFS